MSPEELQALSLPILGTYEEDETFALKPEEQAKEFPLIALRNMSILPGTVVPILVGRRKSMQVIRQSEIRERCFGVVTQRDANVEDPQLSDLFTVGTIVEVSQIVELPTGELSAILRGRQRFSLQHLTMDDPYLMGRVHLLEDSLPAADKEEEYKVTVEDIKAYEAKYGAIPDGAFVALYTGWSRHWPDMDAISGIAADGSENFPSWSMDALKYIYETRNAAANGHETLDTDASTEAAKAG
ncbi:MAG: LON peptidase substrate-binding domain-containing protein, partial [Porphyromonas pasteri]